jgi:hypothetical protein
MEGVGVQAYEDVAGVCEIAVASKEIENKAVNFVFGAAAVTVCGSTDQRREMVWTINKNVEEASQYIKSKWKLWTEVVNNWVTLENIAKLEWELANPQSETKRWIAAYEWELAVAINNSYVELDPFERGKIKGRISLEVGLIVLPMIKPVQGAAMLSKVSVLTRLTEVGWIRENAQLLEIIDNLRKAASLEKPVPPILGLKPPLLYPPVIAEEAGTSETLINVITAKISGENKPVHQAIAEAFNEVASNTHDKFLTLRFGDFVNQLLARAPRQFATKTEAEQFLYDLLTYADWNLSSRGKDITVVVSSTGEGFQILGTVGKGGLEGNHIIKQQLMRVLRDSYGLGLGSNAEIQSQGWVKIFTVSEHRIGETCFHKRLNDWNKHVFSDWLLDDIRTLHDGKYDQAYKVLDEYIKFLDNFSEYRDMIPVVRAFAKVHNIPITL